MQGGSLRSQGSSSAQDGNSSFGERRDCLVRRGLVGYKCVDFAEGPDERAAQQADLTMICHYNALACLFHQVPVNRGLIRIVGRKAVLGMNSIDPYKNLVNEDFRGVALRHITNDSEPVPAEVSPGDANLDVRQMAELHRYVYRVGQHSNTFAVANAAGDLCCCCACAYRDNFSVGNEICCHESYSTFLSNALLFLLLK